jgi:glycosyltransferase involved in cell wall biosynthesis
VHEQDERIRVAFDATALLGTRTGVGLVAAGMLETLAARSDLELHAFAVTWRGGDDLAQVVPPGVHAVTRRVPARAARLGWSRLGEPKAERWTGPVDVVHAPNFVAPPAHAPVVVSVYDLTFLRFPELCTPDTLAYPKHLERALADGATVHTTSDFVADEVRTAFALEADRVVRIYPGIGTSATGVAATGHALVGASRYVATLGTIEPRKNLDRLVRAFDALAASDHEVVLVLAGPDGWGAAAVADAIAQADHGDRIRRLGYLGTDDRAHLLAGATALAYPSVYEGFGLPPLEAMAAGVPVVASNGGALPEVLGDAALLPDPADVDAIADALARVLGDDALRSALVARGHERAARYSWPRAGDDLAGLYHRIAAR